VRRFYANERLQGGVHEQMTDPRAVKGEQEGTRAMFAGAYAVLRNPAGHREVNYGNVTEAAEAVQTASLLMRILTGQQPDCPSPGATEPAQRGTRGY
jgi:hypothetical protein